MLIIDPSHYFGISACFLVTVITLFLAIRLYKNYLETKSIITLYTCLAFLSIGGAILFLGLEKIFLFLESNLSIVTGYIALALAGLTILFQNLFENHAIFPKEKRILSGINLTLIIIYVIIAPFFPIIPLIHEMELPLQLHILMVCTFGPIMISNVLILFYYSYKMRKQSPPHSKSASWMGISTAFFYCLIFVEVTIINYVINNYLRLIYIVIPIFYYMAFTRFVEVDWPNKIRHLYLIVSPKGICVYDHSFVTEEMVESQLIAGGISGITEFIQEITRSQRKLKFMDQEDIKILLEYGTYAVGVLITEEHFVILRTKLKTLIEEFEKEFREQLQNFTGSTDEFQNAKELVEKIFSAEELIDYGRIFKKE